MIRHARPAAALAILPLAVAMIEPSLETLLVAAIGRAMLSEADLPAANKAAIALAAVTVRAQEEHRPAFAGVAKPLPQNHFPMGRHLSSQAALDNDNGSWQVRTSLIVVTCRRLP